jgi:hypothetical protein
MVERTGSARLELSRGGKIALGFIGAWCAMLILQNLTLSATVMSMMRGVPSDSDLGMINKRYLFFILVKLALVAFALARVVLGRERSALLLPAGVILYAFPFGVWIENRLWPSAETLPPNSILSLSAIFSYASATTAVVLWRRTGRTARGGEDAPA